MMQPEPGLWAKSLDVFRRNLKPCLVYVGLVMALSVLGEFINSNSGLTIAQAFAAALLAIPAHLTVLKGLEGFAGLKTLENSNVTMSFVWRGIGLAAIAFVPFFVSIVALADNGIRPELAIGAGLILLLFTCALIFAKWGTMLPATVAGTDKSFARAGQRGSKTFGYAFASLLLPFGFLSALQIALVLGLAYGSNGDGNFFPAAGGVDAMLFLATLLAAIIGAFQVVMTAVILSRAYLLAEGKPAA